MKKSVFAGFMVTCFAISVSAISLFTHCAHAVNKTREQSVVVVINNDVITDFDLKKRIGLLIGLSGISKDESTTDAIRRQALQMLIDETLFEQEAVKNNMTIQEKEIEAALNAVATQNRIDRNKLGDFFKKNNITLDDVKEQLKSQVIWRKIIQMEIYPQISISEQEVEDRKESVYGNSSMAKDREQIKLSEIVIYKNGNNQQEITELLEKLKSEISHGAKFGKLATEFSQSQTASSGGEIGWVYVSQLSGDIKNAFLMLNPGEISTPIVSNDSVVMLKIMDKRVVETKDYKADNKSLQAQEKIIKEQLREVIYQEKVNAMIRSYLSKMRRNAFIKVN